MKYLWIKTCTLFVQFVTNKGVDASFLASLKRDIALIEPDAVVKAHSNQKGFSNKILIQALLYLEPQERYHLIISWLNKFSRNDENVKEIHKYLGLVHDSKSDSNLSYSSTRIYKYTKRIDEAIANSRYSLAIKLTNRCLKEYYYLYLKQKNKLYSYSFYKKDARLLYQHVVDYLNPHTTTKEEQEELMQIAIFTNSLSTMVDDMRDGKSTPDKYTTSYIMGGLKEIMEYLKGK